IHQISKTILFETSGRIVAAVVPGIYGVSETKLKKLLGVRTLALAAPEVVRELTRAEVGYAGPLGLPGHVEVFWDESTRHRTNFEAGANQTDQHLINLNFGRDLPTPANFHDIRTAAEGERCVQCESGTLAARFVLTLGHTTSLGAAYSDLLGA